MRLPRVSGCIVAASALALAAGCADIDEEPEQRNFSGPPASQSGLSASQNNDTDTDTLPCNTVDLLAEQTEIAGQVEVCNDDDNMYVTYEASPSWCVLETHLHVAEDPEHFPTTAGRGNAPNNPIPGHFDFKKAPDECADELEHVISLDDLPDVGEFYIAAQAKVSDKEASGELVANGSFETPEVTAAAGWELFEDSTPGLEWNVDWADPYRMGPATLELHRSGEVAAVLNWEAYHGAQYATLDSEGSVAIDQSLATENYDRCTLEYAWAPRPSHADNRLRVHLEEQYSEQTLVHQEHEADGTDPDQRRWTHETQNFYPNEDTVLDFEETGISDNHGMFLDAVSVKCDEHKDAWGANVELGVDGNLYLADNEPRAAAITDLYAVDLDFRNETAELDFLGDLDVFDENEMFNAQIGHAPFDDVIQGVTRDNPALGLFDLATGTLDFTGKIDGPAERISQAATAPNGDLYVASATSDNIYVVDIEKIEVVETLELDPELNIAGADLAIAPDRTLYLWTNAAGERGLYTVDRDTGETSLVGRNNTRLTGLAFHEYGYLVGSEPNSSNLHLIDPEDASIIFTFTFEEASDLFVHGFGDMTSGQFVVLDFGERFNPDRRGSWATYFSYQLFESVELYDGWEGSEPTTDVGTVYYRSGEESLEFKYVLENSDFDNERLPVGIISEDDPILDEEFGPAYVHGTGHPILGDFHAWNMPSRIVTDADGAGTTRFDVEAIPTEYDVFFFVREPGAVSGVWPDVRVIHKTSVSDTAFEPLDVMIDTP